MKYVAHNAMSHTDCMKYVAHNAMYDIQIV